MKLSIVVAMSVNRVIGRDNALPWKLPADLKHFRELTLGHHLLMGRKTFESIGRPLPGRTTVVITRQDGYAREGILVVSSVDEAVELASKAGEPEAFIAGGAEIYQQTLQRADRLYLTLVHRSFQGDTLFPEFDKSAWQEVSRKDLEPDEENSCAMSFLTYEKIKGATA